ncbi:MAG: hypothetical protein Q9P90_07135 [candidate division KSB1 bacterium]|nr:hypothetical protein [candidate division KSB1 bacterium]
MSLGQKLSEKLHLMQRLEDQMHFSVRNVEGNEKGYRLSEKEGPVAATVIIPDMDKYSLVVSSIELENEAFKPRIPVPEVLRQQAEIIAKKVIYLKEKLVLVELDEMNAAAQIRSATPFKQNGTLQYFEVILKDGCRVILKRYEKKSTEKDRHDVSFLLTEDIFPRLMDDLAEVWRSPLN